MAPMWPLNLPTISVCTSLINGLICARLVRKKSMKAMSSGHWEFTNAWNAHYWTRWQGQPPGKKKKKTQGVLVV
jgi:hypothetical protein